MRVLRVNKKRASDIEAIIACGEAVLKTISGELSAEKKEYDAKSLFGLISDFISEEDAKILIDHTTSLCLLADENDETVEKVMESLRQGLLKFGWEEDGKIEKFDQISPYIKSIIETDKIYITAKASQLISSDADHLHSLRILADVRPVFGRAREHIRASLISSTLSLVVSNRFEVEKVVTVSLGYDELNLLKKECDRAIQKIHAIEAAASEGSFGEPLVYGKRLD